MFEAFIVAFTSLFATVGPIDVAVLFAAMTHNNTSADRHSMAVRGVFISAIILISFALLGEFVLSQLGISLSALKVAGGILLLLIGIEMAFARDSGGISTTAAEKLEGLRKNDIAVFPLATPLIAGPGAMGVVVLLIAESSTWSEQAAIITAILLVLLLTLVLLLLADRVQKVFGVTGMHAVGRVLGVLLSALAVQFIFDGIRESGLFSGIRESGLFS